MKPSFAAFARTLFFAAFFPLLLHANGGPVDGCEFYATGNIVPLRKAEVKIVSEVLQIRLSGDSGYVDVTYLVVNESKEEQLVTYGFPVDVRSNELYEGRWSDSLIRDDFELLLDGESIKTTFYNEPNRARRDSIKQGFGKDSYMEAILTWRRWHVAKIRLAAGKESTIRVRFSTRTGFEDWESSKSFFTSYSDRILLYDFTPASYWGKGVAGKFSLKINAQQIVYNGGTIRFEGLKLRESITGIFEYEGENITLAGLGRLLISYRNSTQRNNQEYIRGKKNITSYITSIRASSELGNNYKAINLTDGNLNNCWADAPGEKGAGQKISITFSQPVIIRAVLIVNGFAKSEELYYKNNRVKRMNARAVVSPVCTDYSINERECYDLHDSTWVPVNEKLPWVNCSVACDFGDTPMCATQLTLEVAEIFPGSKHDDVCIAELYIIGEPAEKK